MNIREALALQSPSLALHRAAQDEISRLDAQLADRRARVDGLVYALRDILSALTLAIETAEGPAEYLRCCQLADIARRAIT
jgi:hypothetical protein